MSVVYTKYLFNGKKILYAIVDQSKVYNKNPTLFAKVRDITYAVTTRISVLTSGDVLFFDTINDAMNHSDDYDLVFIQSVGNFIKSNEILKYFEEYYNSNPDFFMVAFTLDWKPEKGTGWVETHPQMLLVNPKMWRQLGSPEYGGWETVTEELPNYSRSVENFHDKYTPYWMKGEPGTSKTTRIHQGWGFIKAAFANGVRIDNFTEDMRRCRLYVYPESDSDNLYSAFTTRNASLVTNSNQKKWIKSLSPKPTIWIYNSERYYFDIPSAQCDTYFGTASGFKYLDILKHNDKVKFVFYDFHQKSLDWIKEMKETWDGNDFPGYLQSKTGKYGDCYKFVNGSILNNQRLLMSDFDGVNNFKQLWNRFKECDAEFITCNLFDMDQYNQLLDLNEGIPLFYYSNIFATDYTLNDYNLDQIKQHHDEMLSILFNRFPNAISHGCNELGNWINKP